MEGAGPPCLDSSESRVRGRGGCLRHGPEASDLCHTFLRDVPTKKPMRVRQSRAIANARAGLRKILALAQVFSPSRSLGRRSGSTRPPRAAPAVPRRAANARRRHLPAALPMECLTSPWHAPPRGLGCRREGITPRRRPPPGPAPEVLMGQTRAGPALVVRTDDSRRGLRPLRPQATKSRSGLTSQPERHSSWY